MKQKNVVNKIVKSSILKTTIIIVLVIFGSLITRKSLRIKNLIFNNVYNKYMSFAAIKKIYNKYLGDVIPFQDVIKTETVYSDKIRYNDISTFNNGVKLSLDNNYAIPILKDGIVIFIGNKDELNRTVIIQDENGVDTYYGNLSKVNVKLYDYVKKNDLLGEADNNTLYLLFQKGEEYLDYKEFLK
ncbi:MAG: M23 family metallopeptidase [Bacilli bacterium]|nr:M23 family metallopeptidase [Bacilli bacterium]